MKRFITIDFGRGLAIILMIALHVFIKTFNTDILLDAVKGGDIGFAIIAIIIVYFASFAGLFIGVSAMGNLFSMYFQYLKLREKTPNAAKIVRKNQLTRGGIMAIMGYFVTVFLWQYIFRIPPALMINESFDEYWTRWQSSIYWVDIITFIGLATMIVGATFTFLLEKNKSIPEIRRILGWIAVIILVITPFILLLVRSVSLEGYPFWDGPHRNIENRSLGTNILYFFLTIIGGSNQGLFPWLAMSYIGTVMALDLVEGPVTKKFRNKWIKIGIIMIFLGLFLQLLFAAIADTLPDDQKTLFEYGFGTLFGASGPSSAYRIFIDGGELLLIAIIIYRVEGRRRAKQFAAKTVTIRRAGMISLTLYALQFLALVPMIAIESYIFGYPLNNEFQSELWQSLICIVVITAIYIVIPILWEKIHFKGTLEWWVAKMLSKGHSESMDRLNAQGYLYDVEPMGEPPIESSTTLSLDK